MGRPTWEEVDREVRYKDWKETPVRHDEKLFTGRKILTIRSKCPSKDPPNTRPDIPSH